jgi:hypothetical protein
MEEYPMMSRHESVSRRLPVAREVLKDIFNSPDPRNYVRRRTQHHGEVDLEQSTHHIWRVQGSVDVEITVAHKHTMPQEFPRSMTFMTANPGQQKLFTGCFNPTQTTSESDDAWLDPKFFCFTGAGR